MSSTALNGLLEYLYGTLSADNMCWVAAHLMERADRIKGAELSPYTMDEINDRLDKAEQDFDAGLGKTSEEVFKRLDEKFQTELRASTVWMSFDMLKPKKHSLTPQFTFKIISE